MTKLITWFEIPTGSLQRAHAFYEEILGLHLRLEQIGPNHLAIFPYDPTQATGGCLIEGDQYHPGPTGTVVYLNTDKHLDQVLARVPAAGGKVVLPRTELPPGMGAYAHIYDSEGNRVGLHEI